MSVHKRSTNVLEFQIGSKTIHQSSLNDNGRNIDNYLQGGLESICSDQYFDKAHFITQVRLDSAFEMSPCPIDGEFVGLIPDAEGERQHNAKFSQIVSDSHDSPICTTDLCARLWSDCTQNDTMNYQVSFCGHDEIFDGKHFAFVSLIMQLKEISQLCSFFSKIKLNVNLHRFRTIFVSFM